MRRHASAGSAVLVIAFMLAACSGTVDTRPEIIPPLVIPPDLSRPTAEADVVSPATDIASPVPGARANADLAKPPSLPPTVAAAAANSQPTSARARLDGGASPFIALQDDMDEAWRRIGIALEQNGFAVQDRDRSKGMYRVRYTDTRKRGFWSRAFGKSIPPHDYQAVVTSADNGTELRLRDGNGAELAGSVATSLLQRLLPALQ